MGQSANAHLFYGYVWDSTGYLLDDEDGDADYDASEKGKEDHGVEIGWYGWIDNSQPYLYISESETLAYYGESKSVDPTSVRDDNLASWNDALAAFIAEYDIDLSKPAYHDAPKGPGWFLVSSYG